MPDALPIVLQQIDLDIIPGKIPPIVHVSEYDTGRNIVVNLFRDGYPFGSNSIESYTVKVEGSIGKYGFSENAAWADDAEGVVVIHLTEAMTAIHGRVWTKIKLIKSEVMQISTCGFWMDVDRAGVNAQTVIEAKGFEDQIKAGVNEYLDSHQPFFTLPEDGQSGQALLSDGEDGAVWGEIKSGSGLTDAIKTALLACFAKVAWIDQNGQTYYDALSDALYAEDEGGGDEGGGGGDTSDYTDSAAWNLNKVIVYPYAGKGYLEAMTDQDARMVTKTTKALDSGSYYRISCASPYELYLIFCDATDVCQLNLPSQGRTTNLVFLPSSNNKMGVVVATPSTASIADPRNAAVTLAKEKKQTGLSWSLNTAIYTDRINQPFEDIQAPVDARLLLTSFIPLEAGKSYQVRCNSPYQMYLILLDENNNLKKIEGNSQYGKNMVTFTNSGSYAKMSIAVKTPATATQADVSAIEIYVV